MGAVMDVYEKGKVQLMEGKSKVDAVMNLKDFYNDLHDVLKSKEFRDICTPGFGKKRGVGHTAGWDVFLKEGEIPDAKEHSRTYDMYEKYFCDIDKGDGTRDIEIKWEAVNGLPLTHFSGIKVTFYFEIVNRRMETVEVDIGGKKKEMQKGTWEYKTKFGYENPIGKVLDENKILGKWNLGKDIYFKKFYAQYVEDDLKFIEEAIIPKILGVIFKHLSIKGT